MTEETDSTSTDGPKQRSKVSLLIDEYDLERMETKLDRHWQGRGVERQSLRELADHFNCTLLRSAMSDVGMNPLDGEAENSYDLLTGSETTAGARRKAERRLERSGIDVESLRRDFVSHQTIYTFLTDVRGLEYSSENSDDNIDGKLGTIQRLIGRTRSVSETTVDGLRKSDDVSIGEYDITADVQITCRECNSQYDLLVFLRRGHCDCQQ